MTELTGRPGGLFRYQVLDLVRTPLPELSPGTHVRASLGILKYALVKKPSREDLWKSLRNLCMRSLPLKF